MRNPVKVTCVIVTYNGIRWIEKCLKSVLASTVPCDIVIVDNQSTDKTCELIRLKFPHVLLIQSNENLGFGKANNIGLQIAYDNGAEHFFLLNQDAWIKPRTIERLLEQQKIHPEYGVLSPLHFYKDKQLDAKFRIYIRRKKEIINQAHKAGNAQIFSVNFVNAAVWLINRACIEKVGLFAPVFDHYGEDSNFIHRCRYHQVRIGVLPTAVAYHEREQSPLYEKEAPLQKLLMHDKSFCLCVLADIRYTYYRQNLYLLFISFREMTKSVLLLKYRRIAIIVNRIRYLSVFWQLRRERAEMKKASAFLLMQSN